MTGEMLNSGKGESSGETSNPHKSLDEIAKEHGLNPREKELFIINVSMVSQGIIEYFHGDDPEDGLETLDVWLHTSDMFTTMAPKIGLAIAEAVEPFAQALTPKEQKGKRR